MSLTVGQKDLKWMIYTVIGANLFSTCGKRKYFAVIVDNKGHVVGTGYNGGPSGAKHCDQGGCPRMAEQSEPFSSYDNCIAIHAEANAIIHSDYSTRLHGGTLYVNGAPCYSCAKLIANAGITRLVYVPDISHKEWPTIKRQLKSWGVTVVAVDAGDVKDGAERIAGIRFD